MNSDSRFVGGTSHRKDVGVKYAVIRTRKTSAEHPQRAASLRSLEIKSLMDRTNDKIRIIEQNKTITCKRIPDYLLYLYASKHQ